jgi:hypothetical protein
MSHANTKNSSTQQRNQAHTHRQAG